MFSVTDSEVIYFSAILMLFQVYLILQTESYVHEYRVNRMECRFDEIKN